MSTLLDVKNLEVIFDTKDGIVNAVNGISYSLEEGDILGIVGESGCGKSVSAMSMVRLIPEPPAKIKNGEVWFNGVDLLKMPLNQLYQVRGSQVAIIFQDPMTSLNPVMTIGRQIEEAVQVNLHLPEREARKRTIDLLERVGIPKAADRLGDYPHQFSGGMRQRVMIAMAISCQPKLLIADEPTTALDVTIQAQIVELVRQLQHELNMTVIWITHDLGVIARLAKRVNVMYAGLIIECGPIKDIFHDPQHPYTIGLLNSAPKITRSKESGLEFIEGSPPDMIHLPPGCPFAPRCVYVTEKCLSERPALEETSSSHMAACWNMELVRSSQKARLVSVPQASTTKEAQ